MPIQDVIKRFGEPERVTGDASAEVRKRVTRTIATTTTTPTTSRAMAIRPNSSVLNQKTGTANQSGLLHLHLRVLADASGRVVDATARGECR
ncbi:hypothetical protein ACPA9J_14830 [Pseudomonas aeruginosa]